LRFPRPKTLLSLTLVGLGLVTLPLLVGVGNAMLKLNDLMNESNLVVRASAEATLENERVSLALSNVRRYALQYVNFRSLNFDTARMADALNLFETWAPSLSQSLRALSLQDHPETVDAEIATITATLAGVRLMLDDTGPTVESIGTELDVMTAAADRIELAMRDHISARLATIEADTREAQRALAWQAAALIPGTLVLVLFFILLVGRPMRQIDRAIRELGKGDYSHPIAVSGPTDLETLGRQLEWLRHRLTESTEEKNKFLRHMSHELKTPLANIREGTELLLDGSVGTLDRQQQEVTGILRENSVRLQRLIENLLTFSAWQAKTATLAISEFELKPLVFSVLSQHRLVISSREIKLRLEVAAIRVRADEGKLRLVLENLISNAIKFTPEKGAIAIRAEMEGSDLVIEVCDSGPGVAPEDAPRIFEAFYQGRRPQGGPVGGTGIGLSVVHECVQAHGGTVRLRRPGPGQGGQRLAGTAATAAGATAAAVSGAAAATPAAAFSAAPAGQGAALGGAHFVVRLPLRRADDRPKLVVANG
jgi:two-component system sensor histidine kinase GlrK